MHTILLVWKIMILKRENIFIITSNTIDKSLKILPEVQKCYAIICLEVEFKIKSYIHW